ncbi:class I SAM-dependent DNA methyltransferase [Leptolyngbya boryana CZ1]|uniref:site-specific DNA-methyltransferase (adenine-specific) n=1 Tax=Leptolyngbya boryana CZ1 TaxID=3060204 RepID=A0AA97AXM4_LEPBY|nr:class I SAM-dependent DNA methyltransferase [Leptolyngbya boryana]WNZ47516.1 class I SAM-dependent DNA methyltransferase [Leptolyngbya boryana CZ1]
MVSYHQLLSFIWQIADLLRDSYRSSQYERVILPMTVLRRLDCVLAPTKSQVLAKYNSIKNNSDLQGEALDKLLNNASGQRFHNRSPLDLEKLKGDPNNIDQRLTEYVKGFSKNIQKIFEQFNFAVEVERMRKANILYLVVSKFCDVSFHPDVVDNLEMGLLFENLVRRFNEAGNETVGEHSTPHDVIRLMVRLLFEPDEDTLSRSGSICKMLDPACGVGGMLTGAQNYLREHSAKAELRVFGQDFNLYAYAIASSNLLMKGDEQSNIRFGDSLVNDQFPEGDEETNGKFDYLIARPPFGLNWKYQQKEIEREHTRQGFAGRFGAGLPRINDSSLLFLQHMISKFEPYNPNIFKFGSRLAIIFNGSSLSTGGAGSGESEIRKWVIENDWLEAIIALPEQMLYNTRIGTYIWVVTNRKANHRRSKVQLIDARTFYVPMLRVVGDKRRKLGERLNDLDSNKKRQEEPDHIDEIIQLYCKFQESDFSKIFTNESFGYNRVLIERPLRLVYQMNVDRKSRFLDAVPHLLDDVQVIDKELGREPREDWGDFERLMSKLLNQRGSKWKKAEYKLFRNVFTEREPEAEPVVLKERKVSDDPHARIWGWFQVPGRKLEQMYEPDSNLRDFENVRLVDIENQGKNEKEIVNYFQKEVEPYISDSWVDKEKIRTAYEINFNRYFYQYTPPRPLVEIDADIKNIEEEIIRLLREVM